MDIAGLIKKKESGKDKLDPKDMSSISGMDETYIRKAMKHGFLNPPHYTSKYQVDGVELDSHDKERLEKHVENLEKRKGFQTKKNIREFATNLVIGEKRKEGRPINTKYKEIPAEQTFKEFWKSPAGERRMTGKLKQEIDNIDKGGQWYEGPKGMVSMPENYEQILWDRIKFQAADLNALALSGDKDAAEKYKTLQSRFPDQLPVLDMKFKPEEEARVLREKK